jgi:hypothetical protein
MFTVSRENITAAKHVELLENENGENFGKTG